ncbi:type II toxin-antitoxin system RelE family toxin [Amycolatopsis panacis]|nr:type II toxin-antitoxin system RelE/ParE family toxin [Amycolatopsis panacis]
MTTKMTVTRVRGLTDLARVLLLPEAEDDIAELDKPTRVLVFKALKKLQTSPEQRGAPLGSSLTTFRKLYVNNRQYRIVYRVDEDGTVAVIWVIASRVDAACYDLATARLALYGGGQSSAALHSLVEQVFGPAQS